MPAIEMPQLGDAPAETLLGRWLVKVGDRVREDDLLFEVETEKVSAQVPSTSAGFVTKILVHEGERVTSGTPVCLIGASVDETPDETSPGKDGPASAVVDSFAASATPATVGVAPDSRGLLSPVVRRLAREHHIDTASISGSGPRGRVTRNDVLALIGSASEASSVSRRPANASAKSRSSAPDTSLATARPLSSMRGAIAERMLRSKRIAPHVFSMIETDMERVVEARRRHSGRITFLPFVVRAVVAALNAVPELNATIDSDDPKLTIHEGVQLAIAVDVPGRGLYAPVIRDAHRLSLLAISERIADLAARAREGSLRDADLRGSTFTITNPGAFGSSLTAPIINQPNVAILSTEAVERRVVASGNAIEIRSRMNLCMSWDHRAFDGSSAMRFLSEVRAQLQDRDWESELRPGQ